MVVFVSLFQNPLSLESLKTVVAVLKDLSETSIWYGEIDGESCESAIVWDLTGQRYERLSSYHQEPRSALAQEYYAAFEPATENTKYTKADCPLNHPDFERILQQRFFAKYDASNIAFLKVNESHQETNKPEYRLVFPFGPGKPFMTMGQVLEYLSGCLKFMDIMVPNASQLMAFVDSCARPDKLVLEEWAEVMLSDMFLFELARHISKKSDEDVLNAMIPTLRESTARVIDLSGDITALTPQFLSDILLNGHFVPICADEVDSGDEAVKADQSIIAPIPRRF